MTECGGAVSGVRAKSCVVKRDSGSDTVGRRRSDGNGHTTGAGGALYSATETPTEVSTGDDPRGNGDVSAEDTSPSSEATARTAFGAGGSCSGVRE